MYMYSQQENWQLASNRFLSIPHCHNVAQFAVMTEDVLLKLTSSAHYLTLWYKHKPCNCHEAQGVIKECVPHDKFVACVYHKLYNVASKLQEMIFNKQGCIR